MPASFLERLEERVILCDGAMGTMLYAHGIPMNRCFDELNLSMPALVKEVHTAYVRAGAEILETNTFGANPFRLRRHGLEEKLREINLAGVRLAREACGQRALVAGAVGPLGVRIEPLGPTSFDEACEAFQQQVAALVEGGVDLLVLETFGDVNEMRQAIRAARAVTDLPIVAQMTVDDDGNALDGTSPDVFAQKLDGWGADVVGSNCSVGPHVMLETIERMAPATTKKLSAQPNAGLPHNIAGRNIYLCSPDYMASYAKAFIRAGVRLIGGCCGSTPEHIKAMGEAVHALSPPRRGAVRVEVRDQAPGRLEPVPTEQKSALGQKIAAGKFVRIVEIVPPKGASPVREVEEARLLAASGIDAVNIPDSPRASARMSAQALAIMIQQQAGVETLLHYTCRDRNVVSLQGDLLGAHALGLRNLLVTTGDPPKLGNYPDATAVFDVDAIGLANIVANLNKGLDLGSNPMGAQTSFLIGVAANPSSVNLDAEVRRFEWKVKAGAEFAITQPVFDVAQLEEFLRRIEPCRIPLLVSLVPLVSLRNAEFLRNEVPGVFVPDSVLRRMESAESGERTRQEGVRIAQEVLLRVKDMVQGVQVSAPFGRYSTALEVLQVLAPATQPSATLRQDSGLP